VWVFHISRVLYRHLSPIQVFFHDKIVIFKLLFFMNILFKSRCNYKSNTSDMQSLFYKLHTQHIVGYMIFRHGTNLCHVSPKDREFRPIQR
jgi:hypothetical protein